MILMSGIEHVRINDQLKAERINSIGVGTAELELLRIIWTSHVGIGSKLDDSHSARIEFSPNGW